MTYYKTAPVPQIGIGGKILTDGDSWCESKENVWINGDLTQNFPDDSVSLAGYDGEFQAVEIYYRHSTGDARTYYTRGEVGEIIPLDVQGHDYNRTGGRNATINSNGIDFGAASYNTSANNSYAIPYKINIIRYI